MILMFGPAGAGKSLQGQFLALRHNWSWFSAGQLLREAKNPEILEIMEKGNLVPPEMVNRTVFKKLDDQFDLNKVILDGYPRSLDQATALSDYLNKRFGREAVSLIVCFDVTTEEILRRLALRGRLDDNEATIRHRLEVYQSETQPLLDYYASRGVQIAHVDGNRTPGAIFDDVEKIVEQRHVAEDK